MTGAAMRSRVALLALLAACASLASCAKPQNTPEEVWVVARQAFAESRWDLLFDILPVLLVECG